MRLIALVLSKNWLFVGLAVLAAISCWTAIVATKLVPGIGFKDTVRPLAYDLSVGYLVSYLFFILVVVVPALLAKRRTARLLAQHFRSFKLACIQIYLSAIGDSWESELPEELLDPKAFGDYFTQRYSASQNRWHAVHNGLYDFGMPQLIVECELFAREIEYTLIKLDVEDDDVALFLKRMSRALLRLRTSTPDYDGVKALLNFLYPIHSHWSLLEGEVGRDPVGEMLARL